MDEDSYGIVAWDTVNKRQVDSDKEDRNEHQIKKKKKSIKKPAFEDNLIEILNNRQKVDADTSFALSIVPLIRSLTVDQKNQVYIDILTAIQNAKKNSATQTIFQMPHSSNTTQSQVNYQHSFHSIPAYSNVPPSFTSSPVPHLYPAIENHSVHPTYYQNISNTQDTKSSNITM